MNTLQTLAELLKQRNTIENEIAALIGRPASAGHIGEYIAAQIFRIDLHPSATTKGSDGFFMESPLVGKSVNIKFYGKREGILDITRCETLDYYLVLSGPKAPAISSRGTHRPLVIEGVYLFDHQRLIADLEMRKVQIGVATSVYNAAWEAAEIYPTQRNKLLILTEMQRSLLAFFH